MKPHLFVDELGIVSVNNVPAKPKHNVRCYSLSACECAELAFKDGANRDVVDGYDDNCPRRYLAALNQARESAIRCKDQEQAASIILYNDTSTVTKANIKPGTYPIPGWRFEVRSGHPFKNMHEKVTACAHPNCNCINGRDGEVNCNPQLAILIKESEKVETVKEESQEEIWDVAQVRIKEKLGTYSNDLVCDLARWAVEALKEHFTITRKKDQ